MEEGAAAQWYGFTLSKRSVLLPEAVFKGNVDLEMCGVTVVREDCLSDSQKLK